MRTIKVEPLTPEAFRPFGDVVAYGVTAEKDANQGTATRFDHCARFESTRPGVKQNLAVFRAKPQTLPFIGKVIERHPCSSQAFLPLVVSRYLVAVAPTKPDGSPDLDGLRAFVAGPGMGINYLRGTWHHPMVALDAPGDFAMLAHEDGTPQDCELIQLPEPIRFE